MAVLTACSDPVPPTVPRVTRESGLAPSLSGTLHVIWGDPKGGAGSPQAAAFLADAQGKTTRIDLPVDLRSDFGRLSALDGHRVTLLGDMQGSSAGTGATFRAVTITPAEQLSSVQGTIQTGNKKYLTILCKFSDYVGSADTARGKSAYQKWIGEGAVTRTYPSLNHYWYEQSYGKVNFDNSVVKGWYVLPHPRVYYLQADTTTDTQFLDFTKALEDCTGAADPDVNFPDYIGVVVQFNHVLDCCSWGGLGYTLNYDGQSKTYGVAWMADWADQSVYAHESGHSLSLPHSGTGPSTVYNSDWDVMSNAYIFYNSGITPTTYVGEGIPAYDKNWLGWIPASRNISVGHNSRRTIYLDRLDQPAASKTPLMATIPYGLGTDYYTVEARRFAGYDAHLPTEGVIMHQASPGTRGEGVGGKPIFIVYKSLDEYSHANIGAAFLEGETFTDGTNNVTMTVNATTATGYGVTVTNGNASDTWAGQAPLSLERKAFATAASGSDVYAVGGAKGDGTATNRLDAYDTKTDQWRKLRALPEARVNAAAVFANTYLWVAGGKTAANAFSNSLYRYNKNNNTWTVMANMPAAGACGGAVAIGTKVYVFVGCDGSAAVTGKLYRYDTGTNSWTTLASSPRSHVNPVIGVIAGKIYVAGGSTTDASATLDAFDPAAGTWSTKPAMPVAHASAMGGSNGTSLFVVSGYTTGGSTVGSLHVYTPGGTWVAAKGITTKRKDGSAVFVGSALHALGGTNSGNVVATHEVYYP